MEIDLDVARETAVAAVLAAGAILREGFGAVEEVHFKGSPMNIVTEFDVRAERRIVEILCERFPDHNLLTEEEATRDVGSAFTWLVDPLDGTTNFSQGISFFCTSVALVQGNEPLVGAVFDPLHSDLFVAVRGRGATLNEQPIAVARKSELSHAVVGLGTDPAQDPNQQALALARELRRQTRAVRIQGASALELASVACGRLDVFYHRALAPWDFGAGVLMVLEAGGLVTAWGEPLPLLQRSPVLAANPTLHGRMLELCTERLPPDVSTAR
jgi:myo-inositol-1(or 4)-monophosphatase